VHVSSDKMYESNVKDKDSALNLNNEFKKEDYNGKDAIDVDKFNINKVESENDGERLDANLKDGFNNSSDADKQNEFNKDLNKLNAGGSNNDGLNDQNQNQNGSNTNNNNNNGLNADSGKDSNGLNNNDMTGSGTGDTNGNKDMHENPGKSGDKDNKNAGFNNNEKEHDFYNKDGKDSI